MPMRSWLAVLPVLMLACGEREAKPPPAPAPTQPARLDWKKAP